MSNLRLWFTDGALAIFAMFATVSFLALTFVTLFTWVDGDPHMSWPRVLSVFAAVAVALLPFALAAVWWAFKLRQVIEHGNVVAGRVVSVVCRRDMASVMYSFGLNERTISRRTYLFPTKRVRSLRPDQSISVGVDPARPSISVIRDVFL